MELNELQELVKSIVSILADKEVSKGIASFYRNIYNELVSQGFTSQQAMQIIVNLKFSK